MCPLFPCAGYQGSLIQMHKLSLIDKVKMKKMHNMKKLAKYAYVPPFRRVGYQGSLIQMHKQRLVGKVDSQ